MPSGRGFYGQSGAILLPEALAAEVLDRGAELSQAIEAFTGTTGVRDSQGAWGVLTRGLIDRRESFRIAVISAFAPFFNAEMYGHKRGAGREGKGPRAPNRHRWGALGYRR